MDMISKTYLTPNNSLSSTAGDAGQISMGKVRELRQALVIANRELERHRTDSEVLTKRVADLENCNKQHTATMQVCTYVRPLCVRMFVMFSLSARAHSYSVSPGQAWPTWRTATSSTPRLCRYTWLCVHVHAFFSPWSCSCFFSPMSVHTRA